MLGCDSSIDSYVKDTYVAMTRSYQDLYIMYSGQLSGLFDTVPVEFYDTAIGGSSAGKRF